MPAAFDLRAIYGESIEREILNLHFQVTALPPIRMEHETDRWRGAGHIPKLAMIVVHGRMVMGGMVMNGTVGGPHGVVAHRIRARGREKKAQARAEEEANYQKDKRLWHSILIQAVPRRDRAPFVPM